MLHLLSGIRHTWAKTDSLDKNIEECFQRLFLSPQCSNAEYVCVDLDRSGGGKPFESAPAHLGLVQVINKG